MNETVDTDTATARSRAYLLLGRLFLRGVTPEVLPHVRAVEPLAEHLTAFERDADGTANLEAAATAHQQTFGFDVFPFQSVFLDETARAGGRETRRVTDLYREAAFPIVQTAESPDHAGVELNVLGFLSKMEAEHSGADAGRARDLARRFLDGHLLRWFPALRHALDLHGEPFFAALARLTLETLVEHRRELDAPESEPRADRVDGTSEEEASPPTEESPSGAELLEDPSTGLRDIAEHLLVPAKTGIFLSRSSIRNLSRRGNLPAGFGARSDMMSNLLRSAADYDGLEDLAEALDAHVEAARREWRGFADEIPDITGPIAGEWIARLDATEVLVGELSRVARDSAD